jgi:hypothetical protein
LLQALTVRCSWVAALLDPRRRVLSLHEKARTSR